MAMPPASAKAIASLICRRSKYRSSGGWSTCLRLGSCVRADRAVRAELARSVRMLWAEAEVARCDAGGRGPDSRFDSRVIRRHIAHLAAADVEQHETRLWAAGHQASPSSKPVQPQLHRVGLDQCGVQ